MSEILIVTFDAGGNIPLTVRIGQELRGRGNRVRVLAHEERRSTFEEAGFDFCGYRNSPAWDPHADLSTWTILRQVATMTTHPGIGHDLVDTVRDSPPDLVVIDCMLLNALDAAAREGLRHVAVFPSFYGCMDGLFRRSPFGINARAKGLGPRRIWRQTDLSVVCSYREFDSGGRTDDGHVVWTGAVHDTKTGAVGSTPPVVLASLSTGGFPGQRRTLQNILDAAAEMDVELVATTGPAIDPAELHGPSNSTIHQYIPHTELMPTCSAVIGHGGHGTTFRALAHGLPVLTMPTSLLTDQPIIGRTVAATGAGKVLRNNAAPARIRTALEELLHAEHYRTAAAKLGTRLRATDGASTAADQLLRLINR